MCQQTKGASAETWTYGYDHRNQMTWVEKRATDGGTLQLRTDYECDVFGNRIDKQVDEDGDSTVDFHQRYSLDGWKPGGGFVGNENWDVWADLYGATNNLNTRYLRGDAIDELFARIEPGDITSWTLTDRMLSVRDVIINDGTVKNTLVYDGFGKIISETDHMWRGRYAWTGRELDVETKLQYNRARYYDSNIGKWISQDPLGFEAGDSNVYRYANNRLTKQSDPSGLKVFLRLGAYAPFGQRLGDHVQIVWVNSNRNEWLTYDGVGGLSSGTPKGPLPQRDPPKKISNPGRFSVAESKLWDVVISPYGSAEEERNKLDDVFATLKQLPYDKSSTNSNAYAHQLLYRAKFKVKDSYIKDHRTVHGSSEGNAAASWDRGNFLPVDVTDGKTVPPPRDVYHTPKTYPMKGLLPYWENHKVGPTATIGWDSRDWYGGSFYDEFGNPKQLIVPGRLPWDPPRPTPIPDLPTPGEKNENKKLGIPPLKIA